MSTIYWLDHRDMKHWYTMRRCDLTCWRCRKTTPRMFRAAYTSLSIEKWLNGELIVACEDCYEGRKP